MKKKTKCYIYTRVSTSMQVDGYSLDAQRDKLRKYPYTDNGGAGAKSQRGKPPAGGRDGENADEMGTAVMEYDESLVRKLIEKITVYDDHFVVEFKSGLETEVAI